MRKKTACPSKDDWSLYMIRCKRGSLYTGITKDVIRRFEEHSTQSSSCAKYLRGKGPLQLVYCEKVGDKKTALKLEMKIKSLKKRKKEKLIYEANQNPFHTFIRNT